MSSHRLGAPPPRPYGLEAASGPGSDGTRWTSTRKRDADVAATVRMGLGVLLAAGTSCTATYETPCELLPSDTLWVVEDATLDVEIRCRAIPGERPRPLALFDLPAGAHYDPESARFRWTPEPDQAALYEIGVVTHPSGERVTLRIGVLDNWQNPSNVPVVDPSRYPREYGLPVFFLPEVPRDSRDYEPSRIVYAGRTYDAKVRRRGKASLSYPKNNYTLKFPKKDLFSDPEMSGGFLNKRKVSLTQTFDDNSYIRTRLAFDLWNRLDRRNIQIESYSAVVYVDGEYDGLYTVTDHVDGDLLRAQGLWEDGNLYKAASHDANFDHVTMSGAAKSDPYEGFQKKEGRRYASPAKTHADLVELMTFVTSTDDATFSRGIGERINIDDYSSWFILATFLAANDSVAKNVYHYHDGFNPWRVVPWDFNESSGQTWKTMRVEAREIILPLDRNFLFQRLVSNRRWEKELVRRYVKALRGPLHPDAIDELIDGYVVEIDSSARRDEEKWRLPYEDFYRWSSRVDFTSYEEEVDYIRQWTRERWRVLDEELDPRGP